MAGHSKWANIKHKKNLNDAKRGKLYTKLVKEITVAAKEKGSDINTNPRLKLAVQNAKGSNLPKETIEKAIKKASGKESNKTFVSTFYEGYGPMGVAILIECTTDNLNRTVSHIRSLFNKYNGRLSKNGSLKHLFRPVGVFSINLNQIRDEESLTMELIEYDVIDIGKEENIFYIVCPKVKFGDIQKLLERYKIEFLSANIEYEPLNFVSLKNNERDVIYKLINDLENLDDTKKVYHNLKIS